MQLFYLACTEDSALGLSRALQLASYFYSETLPGPPFNFEALDDISDLLVPVHALHRVRSLLSRDALLYYYYSTTSTTRFGGDAFENCTQNCVPFIAGVDSKASDRCRPESLQ